MNLDIDLILFIKINSIWAKALKVKDKTVKLLGENLGDLGFGKSMIHEKENIDTLRNIKIKNSCSMKENEKTSHGMGGNFSQNTYLIEDLNLSETSKNS